MGLSPSFTHLATRGEFAGFTKIPSHDFGTTWEPFCGVLQWNSFWLGTWHRFRYRRVTTRSLRQERNLLSMSQWENDGKWWKMNQCLKKKSSGFPWNLNHPLCIICAALALASIICTSELLYNLYVCIYNISQNSHFSQPPKNYVFSQPRKLLSLNHSGHVKPQKKNSRLALWA